MGCYPHVKDPMRFGFQHSYAALPSRFYARIAPTPAADPQLVVFNTALADELGLDASVLEPVAAPILSGNRLPEDADPIAMAYAGHQFGAFVPSLGDGRAILLGELCGRDGIVRDLQLKGSGRTPFSRNGDGRAVVGPMLREYLVSEAMHALGVPTTRSLAVVTTGEQVFREGALPGAVLTRVAMSHVRVGTFQYFAARGDQDAVRALLEYVIARHYPAAREADVPALELLKEVARRQVALIADWMLLGFIHGVMNTDNMAISGETIDYGPCAFMDNYDPSTVFSSIDHGGRYAYANQPVIAQWNLARFAETLLSLIDPDAERAVSLATAVLEPFTAQFDARFLAGMGRKIGLASILDGDVGLIRRLLEAMQHSQEDFTLTFRQLTAAAENPHDEQRLRELFGESGELQAWLREWRERLRTEPQTDAGRATAMRSANPAFIPRNHRVQAALDAADRGDYRLFHRLLAILKRPYEEQADVSEYRRPPQPSERVLQTFCGT
jgi:serine/tyrosine/threonine adenylyltransferase